MFGSHSGLERSGSAHDPSGSRPRASGEKACGAWVEEALGRGICSGGGATLKSTPRKIIGEREGVEMNKGERYERGYERTEIHHQIRKMGTYLGKWVRAERGLHVRNR